LTPTARGRVRAGPARSVPYRPVIGGMASAPSAKLKPDETELVPAFSGRRSFAIALLAYNFA